MNIGDSGAVMVHPILSGHSASEGHIAVRVRQTGTGDAFWQGELILHRQHNGQILVDIDKSVRSETHVGGLDNGVVNIYANQHIGSNWHEVQLRIRGPKNLADAKDVSPPAFSGKERHLRVRVDYPGVPLVETARLTLSHRLPDNRECYTQLLAGPCLNLGRARTWDSKNHRGLSPNEIVLRSHRDDESDDYLSRFHGRLKFTSAGIEYENLSGGGTLVGHRQLSQKGDKFQLSDNVLIRPGQAMASNKDRSLGLQARRTECQISAESYNLLAQEAHLNGGVNTDIRNDVVTLTRTDRLQDSERYIFFRQAVRVGANAICGWHLPTDSVQQIHATLLWFDESFWIEPYAVNCLVRVNGVAVAVNRLRRLLPNSELELGALRFLVLPEWKQHIISCQCCPGHGYEEGCRCSPCVEDWERRKQ
jgi:hypothetical protein